MKKKPEWWPDTGLTEQEETTFLVFTGLIVLSILSGHGAPTPKWVKDLPPTREKLAGAWRGKGSYGKAPFGTQTRHRSR